MVSPAAPPGLRMLLKMSRFSDHSEDVIMAEKELVVGSIVPDFSLPSNKGGEVKFSDYRGRKVAMFFVREYE